MDTFLLLSLLLTIANDTRSSSFSKRNIQHAKQQISLEHKQATQQCDSLHWSVADICIAEADGKRSIYTAELYANYKPTATRRYQLLIAQTTSRYQSEMTPCNAIQTVGRQSCRAKAKTRYESSLQDADQYWKKVARPRPIPTRRTTREDYASHTI